RVQKSGRDIETMADPPQSQKCIASGSVLVEEKQIRIPRRQSSSSSSHPPSASRTADSADLHRTIHLRGPLVRWVKAGERRKCRSRDEIWWDPPESSPRQCVSSKRTHGRKTDPHPPKFEKKSPSNAPFA
ncbi:hypothetical protein MMC07_007477, partial [Pseudocyphellaria aurata]|nr:hypothetical protein [Pseudocyphellaria aurata]